MAKRKIIGTIYKYKTGKYVREKLATKHGCTNQYRVIPVPNKPGRKILICITKKEGPRGGRTKAIALLRHISTKKGRRLLKKAKIKRMKRKKRK